MVLFMDLMTGPNIKKSLNALSVSKRYHNKNKSGGNFGINVMFHRELKPGNYEFNGDYNTRGEIVRLTFAPMYQGVGVRIIRPDNYQTETYQSVMNRVKEILAGGY